MKETLRAQDGDALAAIQELLLGVQESFSAGGLDQVQICATARWTRYLTDGLGVSEAAIESLQVEPLLFETGGEARGARAERGLQVEDGRWARANQTRKTKTRKPNGGKPKRANQTRGPNARAERGPRAKHAGQTRRPNTQAREHAG